MGNFKGWEWILILVLALLLFGGFKKLPDAARGIGRSLRIFKAETKGLADDDSKDTASDAHPEKAATDKALASTGTADGATVDKAAVDSAPTVAAPLEKEPVAAPPAGEDSSTTKN